MVRDADGLPAPVHCPLDISPHVSHAVHIAHLCMKMQLDALFSLWHPVHTGPCAVLPALDAFDPGDGQLRVELSVRRRYLSGNRHPFAGLQLSGNRIRFVFLAEQPAGNGIRLVGKVEFDDELSVSGLHKLRAENEAGDDDPSHPLLQGFDLQGLSLEIIAVDHIRVVGFFIHLGGPLIDGLFEALLPRFGSLALGRAFFPCRPLALSASAACRRRIGMLSVGGGIHQQDSHVLIVEDPFPDGPFRLRHCLPGQGFPGADVHRQGAAVPGHHDLHHFRAGKKPGMLRADIQVFKYL